MISNGLSAMLSRTQVHGYRAATLGGAARQSRIIKGAGHRAAGVSRLNRYRFQRLEPTAIAIQKAGVASCQDGH